MRPPPRSRDGRDPRRVSLPVLPGARGRQSGGRRRSRWSEEAYRYMTVGRATRLRLDRVERSGGKKDGCSYIGRDVMLDICTKKEVGGLDEV